jgi:hypothetical protein
LPVGYSRIRSRHILPSERAKIQQLIKKNMRSSEVKAVLHTEEKNAGDTIPNFLSILSPFQQNIISDPSQYKALLLGRRGSKTFLLSIVLLQTAYTHPGTLALYIATTRISAKRIIWEQLKAIAKEYHLSLDFNESELSIRLPGDSRILLGGCPCAADAERYRGGAYSVVCIDEGGAYPSYLEYLVMDVLDPALQDCAGSLYLAGTPGPIPKGYFHDITMKTGKQPLNWKVFNGTVADNSKFPRWVGKPNWQQLAQDFLAQEKTKHTLCTYEREWLGKWVSDVDSLVFPDVTTFHFTADMYQPGDQCIIGVDTGVIDETGIIVALEKPYEDKLYIIDEYKHSFKGSREPVYETICNKIREFNDIYHPVVITTDPAACGKSIIQDLSNLYNIPIKSADKTKKEYAIQMTADCFHNKKILVSEDLKDLREELGNLYWNDDHELVGPDHLCDCVLYSMRESALFWKKERPEPKNRYIPSYLAEDAMKKEMYSKIAEEREQEEMDKPYEIRPDSEYPEYDDIF